MKIKIFLIMVISFIFLYLFSFESYCATNEFEENSIENITLNQEENQSVSDSNINEENNVIINEIKNDIIKDVDSNNENIVYNGMMYIDSPYEGYKYLKSNDSQLEIEGWAVSNDKNAKIKLYIDNQIINDNLERIKREDIDLIVSPNYGGVENTPLGGYKIIIDINNLDEGTHKIRLEQVSRYGEIISVLERNIEIENKKYNGIIYIDTPNEGNKYIREDTSKLEIEGWAVSNDKNAKVRLYIDNQIINDNVQRVGREDVDNIISPNYGGIKNTPLSGYKTIIDISCIKQGKHIIRVEEISGLGDIIAISEKNIEVENKKYEGIIYIDSPNSGNKYIREIGTILEIEGWAVSNDKNAKVRLYIDNQIVNDNVNRIEREDINILISPNYGGIENTPLGGYKTLIDIGNLEEGIHCIRLEEVSRYGDIISASEKNIEIENKKYDGIIYIDYPIENSRYLRPDKCIIYIEGWAVSNDSEAKIRLYFDNKIICDNVNRNKREDIDLYISPNYGGVENTPLGGYKIAIDVGNQKKGSHRIRLEEVSRYGDIISVSEKVIEIENKIYTGMSCIDTPEYNGGFIRPDDTEILIKGWCVSTDREAVVRIYIDGNIITYNAYRTLREDVDQIISPNYGGTYCTPFAGYKLELNIDNYSNGNHVVRIEECSRYGDIIAVCERNFYISNKTYIGEMCIDYPEINQSYKYGSEMYVAGWAVSNDESAVVEIYVDNTFKGFGKRYYRLDIDFYEKKYEDKTVNSGYTITINLDGLSSGTHRILICEKSRYGDIIGQLERSFIVKSNTQNNNNNNNSNSDNDNDNDVIHNNVSSGTKGIDVSCFQGNINWSQVASSGIKYTFIRAGYRGYGNGKLMEDTKFQYNVKNAVNNGIRTGLYFYSTAINTTEAKKDAEYIISLLDKYGYRNKITMPIAIDLELIPGVNTRDINVGKQTRTNIANTFCQTIASYGYTPMIYANKSFLNDNMYHNQINYDVWVAQYNSKCTYSGKYTVWQYTSSGSVSGISGNVDCNILYKTY